MSNYTQKIEQHKQKLAQLRNDAFTSEFKEHKILTTALLDKLDSKIDNSMIYNNGDILSIEIKDTTHNREILAEIITNFDVYKELSNYEMDYKIEDGLINITSIITYSEDVLNDKITYDISKNEFCY